MDLPVDVKALIDEATNIKEARATDIAVSVYVDTKAPADLVAHVRGTFASGIPTVRFALTYLDRNFEPQENDDIAIIVAGASASIGAAAAALRGLGVPTMVATLSPNEVAAIAEKAGHAIPEGDLVAPCEDGQSIDEPISLDDDSRKAFDERMGRWIVAVCHEKRLAFAIAFPFMRRALAVDAVQATSIQNAGIGLVPIIPGADLPIMTLNQAKMVLQIAAAYGHEMDKNRLKELAAVVGGAYVCRTLARELTEFIPVLGFAIRTGVAYGGTSALGHAVIEYFEGGESVGGVTNVASSAAEAGAKFVANVRGFMANPSSSRLASKVSGYVPIVREQVDKYVPIVRDAVGEYAPKIADTAADILSKAVSK